MQLGQGERNPKDKKDVRRAKGRVNIAYREGGGSNRPCVLLGEGRGSR